MNDFLRKGVCIAVRSCEVRPVGNAMRSRPRYQRGSAIIEYSIITFLAIIVLISQENQVAALMDAIKDLYRAFTYSLSMTFPTELP